MKRRTYTSILKRHFTALVVIAIIVCCAFNTSTYAQHINKADTLNNSRFYAGVEFSSIYYRMVKDRRTVSGEIIPVAHFNLGYRLSKRVQLELGLSYGRNRGDELRGTYYGYNDTIIYHSESWEHRGVAMPLTIKYTPFNLNKRLNLYGTASLIPVIGEVNRQLSETYEGERTVTYSAHDSGLYLHATAGLLLNYKFSKKLEGHTKANLLIEDLKIKNYYRPKSLSVGLNYNL